VARARALSILLSGLVMSLLVAPAAMAAPAPGGAGQCRPLYQCLHSEIENWIESTGARQAFLNLGVALYMFLGMVQTYSAVMGTSAAGISETVFRVIMAGFLISLVQNRTMSNILGSAYEAFAGTGIAILERSVGGASGSIAGSFENLSRNLGDTLKRWAGLATGLVLAVAVALLVSGAALALLAIYGVFAALYIVVQLFALVILSIALLLAPLSFAAFAYRGTSPWTWHWVKGVLNALLTVLLANIVAGVVAWFAIRGPEAVINAVPGEGSQVGAFFSSLLMPFTLLVIAPFLGIMALLRVETVVAHFSAAFGDFTGTMEQLLTSRLLFGQLRWRGRAPGTVPGAGAGPGGSGGGGDGGGGGGGGAGGGVPPRYIPPAPTVPAVRSVVQVSDVGPQGGWQAPGTGRMPPPGGGPFASGWAGQAGRHRPSPEAPAGAAPGGFAPLDAAAAPGGGRPPGWQSLSEWSQKWFGVDLAPWQTDPSVPVPRQGMSAEELRDIYSKAAAAEGMQVKDVSIRGGGVSITVEQKPESVAPGAAPKGWQFFVKEVEGTEIDEKRSTPGGLHVTVTGTGANAGEPRVIKMQWDGQVAGLNHVKEAEGLMYSGDWRARVPGGKDSGSGKGGGA